MIFFMLEIYELKDEKKWKEIINQSIDFDFYHTHFYHQIALNNGEGIPKLFVFNSGNEFVALPLLQRKIPNHPDWVDFTSVYGYAGPVVNCIPSYGLINDFENSMRKYFIDNQVVSVFSRLHPLLPQEYLLNELGDVVDLSFTVTVDLTLSEQEQLKCYRKSNKYEINQLRKNTVLKFAENKEEIDAFIDIYIENMQRVNAHERYFFSCDYFYQFLKSNDYKVKLLMAYDNDIAMAGAIFVFTKNIVQYHLAGTHHAYLQKTPMKLILDEIRRNASQWGYKYLHLGGGVGNSNDSLFNFKAGFSKRFDQFKIWRYIVNQDIYNHLVEENAGIIINENYFPKYRG